MVLVNVRYFILTVVQMENKSNLRENLDFYVQESDHIYILDCIFDERMQNYLLVFSGLHLFSILYAHSKQTRCIIKVVVLFFLNT